MFFLTYRTTIKTLVRSFLVWTALALLVVVTMNLAISVNYSTAVVDNNYQVVDIIYDTDPRYELTFDKYIQTILNAGKAWIMLYAMPLFCVITTFIVLSRNYNDGFFEIERSAGVGTFNYCLGRISALITINSIVCVLITFLCFHYYYFSRGGVESFTLSSYLIDSTTRILRLFCLAMLPGIMLYTSITYVVGSLLKSSIGGTIIGLSSVLLQYSAKTFLHNRFSDIYHDYISPISDKLYQYWAYYDTEWFTEKAIRNPFTQSQMITALCCILIPVLLCISISYVCTRKRDF